VEQGRSVMSGAVKPVALGGDLPGAVGSRR
jgi:hypothetical protein